jgi:DNA repair protein RecN (Recombination protein N)
MLSRLYIQNLATVTQQIIEFEDGFTVLTGETGAGKTIIIKAVNLVLGEKCPKDLIRAGEDFLSVEAVFNIDNNPDVNEILANWDIEHDGAVSIRRKVHQNGRSSVFVNGYTLKLNQLAELGRHLIDLHGQHSQQALLQPTTHIRFLDQFAGLGERVRQYQSIHSQLNRIRKQQRELEENAAERQRRLDFLRFQIDEIDKAGVSLSEEEQLQEECHLLSNGEQIIQALAPIADWNSAPQSPLTEIAGLLQPLQNLLRLAPELQRFAEEIRSGLITLEEAVADVNHYLSRLEINPERLEWVNERLSLLDGLKRKYGGSLTEIFAYREAALQELTELEETENQGGQLEEEIKALEDCQAEQASALSRDRQQQAGCFEQLVQANLQELGLEHSRFQIALSPLPDDHGRQSYTAKGIDQVAFLITTNPGQPLRPLARVASGGEISRIMLAIKTSLNEDITRGTMIFDEVDVGISGRVADSVGAKLERLGSQRQIICITHSPQIAARGRHHFKVEKIIADNASQTLIKPLTDDDRVDEIARFLGGDKVTAKTLSVAREMLKNPKG